MSYVLAFCLAMCWGTAFLTTKNIVDVIPPYWGTFYRVLAGLLFFAILYAFQRKDLRISPKQIWRPWLISFLLILFPFAAISWSQRFVSPTVGGIFNGTTPIWSFIAGAILLKGVDRFTWRRAFGVVFGLLGLLCITLPNLKLQTDPWFLYGCLGFIFMSWSYSLGNVLTKKIMVDNHASSIEANTFHQYLFSAVVLLAVAWSLETPPALADFSSKVIISILFAGVFSSAVAFLLMVALIKRWGATRMASVCYCSPLIAMLSDMIFRHRFPQGNEVLGMCVIFISLFLIQKPVEDK